MPYLLQKVREHIGGTSRIFPPIGCPIMYITSAMLLNLIYRHKMKHFMDHTTYKFIIKNRNEDK